MKISVCLGVKDEIELIGPAIAHLRTIGVDHIIALDSHSTDGTAEYLAGLAGAPWLDLMPIDEMDPEVEKDLDIKIGAMARAAGSDWLLYLDADEFPLPRSGRLKDVLALADADAVEVARYNVPLGPGGPCLPLQGPAGRLDEVLLFVPEEGRAASQSRVRDDVDAPWIQVIPAPKMMVRLSRAPRIAEGGHGALDATGRVLRAVVPPDLVIAHLPFSSEARFARKVDNIRSVVGKMGHLWGPDSAWHWRRWLDNIDNRGGVSAEVARNRLTEAELTELRRSGLICTAAEMTGGQ